MPRIPRALANILKFSGTTAVLIARVRDQSALLALVKRELEPLQSEHIVAALMRNKQLILYADSSAWASRLRFSSRMLRDSLVRKGQTIEKITVRISIQSGDNQRHQQIKRRLSRENGDLIDKTADNIEDASLRQALRRLSRHSR